MLANELGEANENPLALLRSEPRPHARIERPPRAAHGAVDVFSVAGRDRGDHTSGSRADAIESLAGRRVDVLAVDECLRANRDPGENVVDGGGHGAPPARSGSMMTTVRAPSPRRSRSSAASTPSRSVVCVTTVARSSSPASRELRQLGQITGGVARAVVRPAYRLVGEEVDPGHRDLDPARHETDDDRLAAGTDRVPGEPDRVRTADDLEGVIGTAAGALSDGCDDILGGRVDRVGRADGPRKVELLRIAVDGNDRSRAGEPSAGDHLQTDAAAADHAHASRRAQRARHCGRRRSRSRRRSRAAPPARAAARRESARRSLRRRPSARRSTRSSARAAACPRSHGAAIVPSSSMPAIALRPATSQRLRMPRAARTARAGKRVRTRTRRGRRARRGRLRSPTDSTTPAPSCPSTIGHRPLPSSPSARCTSEWQTPAAATRTSTSSAFGGSSSTSSTSTGRPGARRTTARSSSDPPLLERVEVGHDAEPGARQAARSSRRPRSRPGAAAANRGARPAALADRTGPRRTGTSRRRARGAG